MKNKGAVSFVLGITSAVGIAGLLLIGIALGSSMVNEVSISEHALFIPGVISVVASCALNGYFLVLGLWDGNRDQ